MRHISYEDFFEGYRPRPGIGGGIEFELRPQVLCAGLRLSRAQPRRHLTCW